MNIVLEKNTGQESPSRRGHPGRVLESLKPKSWLEGGIVVLDAAGGMVEINDALCNWLEQTRAGLLKNSFWELLQNLAPDWNPLLLPFRESAAPFARFELKIFSAATQSSQWFALEMARARESLFIRIESILPPRSELEEGAWDAHLSDDLARREMFMRLLRAEARWDSLMRRWPCVIFSQRPDFSLQLASPNIEEMTGIPMENWSNQSRSFWQIVHEADAAELQKQFKSAVQTGASVTNTYRIRHFRTGRVIYILEYRQPTLTQNGLLLSYEVIWLDVTRQTIAEKRLSATAWKETLAVLTLGMAHDFRNMMAGIQSLSEGFLEEIEPKHPFYEGLALIKSSSVQANQLVNAIINLHLGQAGQRNYQNLNEVASELVDLVGKILPRRIRVIKQLAEESLPIYVDLVEFRQTIINLLLNAADAMPEGGTLTLRTSRQTELPKIENLAKTRLRPPCVCLSIEDTGCGIKERHLAAIFDPFFTTKSKGSGLGLYNARIAVEKHRGSISVESKEGQGTTFRIWLPESDFSEASEAAFAPEEKQNVRHSILLYGQTGDMLDSTAEFLRLHNFLVVIADSPESVLELLQSSDYQFAGIMLLAEPNDRALEPLLKQLQQEKKQRKTILNCAGCNQDDLDAKLSEGADLLLNSDTTQTDMLGKLKSLFDSTH